MTETLRDQQAREKINTIFSRNFLVEAGAGSGKTTSLTRRMVAAVAGGHVPVHQMAAITYTRKAAAELKERFQEELEKASLEAALQDMHRCYVGTIHSFCSAMLRERPVEAGIDPEFTELDESENQQRLAEAWEDYLSELKVEDSPLLHQLEAIGVDPADLKDMVRSLADYPDVTIHTLDQEKPDLPAAKKSVRDFVEELKPYLPEREPEKGYDALQASLLKADRMLRRNQLEKEPEIVELLEVFDRKLSVTLNRWPDGNQAKVFRDKTAPLFHETIIKPALESWRGYCHPIITNFIKTAVDWYAKIRRKNGWVNYQDLLLNTASLLRHYPEVRQYFQNKYKSLLVDEFQDTDPIQTEILFYLTGTDPEEKNWQKIIPKPGSLFVVGDPKQSIYRFRRADIDLYQQVKERITATGGEVLELTTNFRSVHALSNRLNPVFQEMLPEESTSYQAAYAPMETQKDGENNDLRGVKILKIPDDFSKKEEVLIQDAKQIASLINQSKDKAYSDFLILTRYKDSMHLYTRELEALKIPYRVAGGSDFENEREIKEVINLLRLLENPRDKILLVAVLRGLFFGISDDQLYQYKRSGGRFSLWADPPEDARLDQHKSISAALEILKEYHQWFRKYPFSAALEKMMADTGLIPSTWQEPEGRVRCGHLIYLLEHLKKEEVRGVTSSFDLLQSLQSLLETGIEEELDITGEENLVRIMNLHKAKGLEAPIVFLAHPAKKVNRTPDRHITRSGEKAVGCWAYTVSQGNYNSRTIGKTKDWETWEAEETNYQVAEEERLLYVAATRAKEALIISKSGNDSKNPWERLFKNVKEEDIIDLKTLDPEVQKASDLQKNLVPLPEILEEPWSVSLWEATYSQTTPTEDKDLKALWEGERAAGGGKSWGTLVHSALEYLIKHKLPEESLLRHWLEESGLESERLEELKKLLQDFQKSQLWQRIQSSPEVYTEVPFHLKEEKDGKPVFLSGIIDLVFKEGESWIIVDYKTDRLKDPGGYAELEKAYQSQIQQYRKVWQTITGEVVSQSLVYFLGWQ